MASRKEEKERLRAQRLAAERAAQSGGRTRLMAGYVVAGVLALAVIAGLVAVVTSGGGGGSGSACSNAHIQNTGSFSGLTPDCRKGTPPPPLQFADLQISAQKAGCELRLNLPDEGNTHVPNSTPVQYRTSATDVGQPQPGPDLGRRLHDADERESPDQAA